MHRGLQECFTHTCSKIAAVRYLGAYYCDYCAMAVRAGLPVPEPVRLPQAVPQAFEITIGDAADNTVSANIVGRLNQTVVRRWLNSGTKLKPMTDGRVCTLVVGERTYTVRTDPGVHRVGYRNVGNGNVWAEDANGVRVYPIA